MKSQNGSIRKRPNGTWEYRATIQGVRKSFYGRTRNETLKKAEEYIKHSTKHKTTSKTTVAEWSEVWLETYKREKVGYSTYRNYKLFSEKYINPTIGNMQISQVRAIDVESLLSSQKVASLSPSGQKQVYLTLKGIFDAAVENDICERSPVKKRTNKAEKKITPKVFLPDDVQTLIETAKSHEHGNIVLLLLYTGLRIGELCALKWSDINGDTITVQRNLAKQKNGYAEKTTKTGKERFVIITEELQSILDAMPRESEYVLTHKGGQHNYNSILRQYNQVLSASGVPRLSPHKCRHTYATYLVQSGADILFVRDLLGHSTVETTQIYAHVNLDPLKQAAKKLKYTR